MIFPKITWFTFRHFFGGVGGKTPCITNMGSLCIYVKVYQNHLHCNFFLSGVSSTNLMEQQKSVAQNKFKFHHLVWVHPITQDVSHHQDYYIVSRESQLLNRWKFATMASWVFRGRSKPYHRWNSGLHPSLVALAEKSRVKRTITRYTSKCPRKLLHS